MNRNVNSHFALNPTDIDISRSKFDRNSSVKFSGNVGDLIPFYVDEVLPGDTFQIQTSLLARLQPLVAPIMDNIYLDTYYFFVPARLCWEHWKQFNGENTESKWLPETQYSIPQITAPTGGWSTGTIADYMGIPVGVDGISISALPFRAYALICNEWFRDENNTDYLDVPFGDATVQGVNTGTFVTDVAKGGKPFRAAKYHDYFTSALPSPQKGPDVTIGIAGNAPVFTDAGVEGASRFTTFTSGSGADSFYLSPAVDSTVDWPYVRVNPSPDSSLNGMRIPAKSDTAQSNLYADLASASSVTVNALRLAFATQKMYEKDARGGSRYVEMIKAHFGVTSPDARQQRPEYLGGNHVPINVNQVVQSSGVATSPSQGLSQASTPLGRVAGYSVTSDVHGDFIKSFTEHGFVIGICVMRYDHTYQQGIEKFWSRRTRTDFYLPVFANLGEQPILNKEIYASGTDTDDEVFGYQEAWAEYRYKPSRVAGEMRSMSPTPLDSWHLADFYSQLPVLQSDWIFEDLTNVNRSLSINSLTANQFIADFYIRCECTRPMPLYSIPGLIDHH